MKSNHFKNTIGGAVLASALLFGISTASGVTAQAQNPNDDQYQRNRDRNNDRGQGRRDDGRNDRNRRGRNWDGYRNYGGSFQLRQTALNAGYNEGIKEGRKDRSHRDRFDFRDEGAYQKATKDYSSRLGDRWTYQRYFRDAFENGYEAGYNGY
jgi:hypothetical protein